MRKLTIPFWLLTLVALYGCGGSSSDTRDASASSSSSSASGSGSSSSQALNENWRLVWRDEFDGEAIDADKWHFEENCVGGGNNELQCYTARPENAYVADGYLNIVAREETYRGPGRWDDDPAYDPGDTSVQRDYTSARLRSKGKGDFTYGRVEIRAKLPQGQGIWPALWMLPTESVYGGWPRSGEIDILEAINSNGTGGNEIHGTLHYGSAWPDNRYSGTSYEPSTRVWEDFHTYAVEWSEGEIHWFVDETHYATQTSAGWFTYYEGAPGEGFVFGQGAAPFDQAFHLIMNLAVGGNWPGAPDESTEFPQSLQVDYVRVYECALDPATGKGCSDRLDEQIAPLAGHPAPARQSYWLYRDGVASVSLAAPAGEVETGLEAESDQAQSGNLIVDFAAATDSGSKVLSAEFLGPANLFLAVAEPPRMGLSRPLTYRLWRKPVNWLLIS